METNFDAEKKRLSERLKQYHDWNFTPGNYKHSIFGLAALLLDVEAVPVVHGRWLQGYPIYCSVCNGSAATEYEDCNRYEAWLSLYCPHCGAKMDLEER